MKAADISGCSADVRLRQYTCLGAELSPPKVFQIGRHGLPLCNALNQYRLNPNKGLPAAGIESDPTSIPT